MAFRLSLLFALGLFLVVSAESQSPIYITGTVALDGGGVLPSVVRVQLKCHSSVVQAVFTSPDGRFTFTMTEEKPGVKNAPGVSGLDASIGGPAIPADVDKRTQVGRTAFRQVDLSRCWCEASLPGYRAEPVSLGVRSRFDNPDVGVITLYPLGSVKGVTVSVTTLSAPRKALDAYAKAQKELAREKVRYAVVVKHLTKATEIYPAFAEAWQLLGETFLMDSREDDAKDALQKAAAADPNYVTPYVSLAELELKAGHFEEAAQLTTQAVGLNPYLIRAQYWNAVAQFSLGEFEEAEESIGKVQASVESHLYPASHHLLGSILAERGQYETAAKEFRLYVETDPPEDLIRAIRETLEQWTKAGLIEALGTR